MSQSKQQAQQAVFDSLFSTDTGAQKDDDDIKSEASQPLMTPNKFGESEGRENEDDDDDVDEEEVAYQRARGSIKSLSSARAPSASASASDRTQSELADSMAQEPRRFEAYRIYNKRRDKRRPFIDNKIHTAKYNFFSFLPKNLFYQFSKMTNMYFLTMTILDWQINKIIFCL